MTLPAEVQAYRRTPEFTEATVPPALLKAHTTKDGTWALIHVLRAACVIGSRTRAAPPQRPS